MSHVHAPGPQFNWCGHLQSIAAWLKWLYKKLGSHVHCKPNEIKAKMLARSPPILFYWYCTIRNKAAKNYTNLSLCIDMSIRFLYSLCVQIFWYNAVKTTECNTMTIIRYRFGKHNCWNHCLFGCMTSPYMHKSWSQVLQFPRFITDLVTFSDCMNQTFTTVLTFDAMLLLL